MESALVDELPLDLEEAGLAVVHEDEPGRAHARDLAAELRADRSAGAGDEHDLAREIAGDRLEVGLDGLAPEEVLDLDGPELAREVEVAGDQLVQARQRLHRHALVTRATSTIRSRASPEADGIAIRSSSGRRSRRSSGRSAVVPMHADPVQAKVLLARVVVDEADRRVAERRVSEHLAQDQLGGVSGADDEDLLAARDDRPGGRPLDDRPREEARRP